MPFSQRWLAPVDMGGSECLTRRPVAEAGRSPIEGACARVVQVSRGETAPQDSRCEFGCALERKGTLELED